MTSAVKIYVDTPVIRSILVTPERDKTVLVNVATAGVPGPPGPPGSGVNIIGSVPTEGDLPATANPGDGYITEDTDELWVWTDTGWVNMGGPIEGPPGPAGADGVGVPVGGTAGQVLAKVTSVDYDTGWVDQTGGSGGGENDVVISDTEPSPPVDVWIDTSVDAPQAGAWVQMTQAAYDALPVKDPNTLFIIVD